MRPLIGITCGIDHDRYYLSRFYSQGVEAAGGIPVLLPPVAASCCPALHQKLDGLILSGGVDLDPAAFGEEPRIGLGEITPERDAFELALTKVFLATPKPILAICRGLQLLNVAAGGTLWQDIAALGKDTLKHTQEAPRWYATHTVEFVAGTKLHDIFKQSNSIRVNSFHHQAIKTVAEGFMVSAVATDGIIEAIEARDYPYWLGVQWHPECMWEKDSRQMQLFESLVTACCGKNC